MERIARDAPLDETLENLVRLMEAQFADLLCSIPLLDEDGQRVRHGAAPSLPKAYTEAIDGGGRLWATSNSRAGGNLSFHLAQRGHRA